MLEKFALRDHVISWVDRAIDVQDGAIRGFLAQVGENVDAATADGPRAAAALESQYLATMSGAGAAVGGAASIPGIGTGLALGLSVAETVAFLDATALFTLAVAEFKGHVVRDLPRRRALLLLVLLGGDAVELVPPATDGVAVDTAHGWGRRLLDLDDAAVAEINRTAEKWLLTRFGARQGLYVLGRLAPFGIGAAVGAAGNAVTAKGVIARLRTAFSGQAPAPAIPVPTPDAIGTAAVDTDPVDTTAVDTTAVDTDTGDVTEDASAGVEPPTGKYAGLHAFLESISDDEVLLPIATLEDAVTGNLPAAARQNPAWWGNVPAARAPQTRAWLAAGFHVAGVELADDEVRLRRGPVPAEVTTA